MKTIVFDVMGNDNGVQAGVEAAVLFINLNPEYKIILVGNKEEILKYYKEENSRIEIIDEKNVANKNETNLRNISKTQNSMTVSLDMIIENKAQAMLSSGDSASYLAASTLKLKRLEGMSRPAFMPMIPVLEKGKYFLMLDVGANIEVKPEYLVQWAKVGSIFHSILFSTDKPRIGLLNIGTEDYKGFDYHKEANVMLKQEENLNYQGFVESRNLLDGQVDVVVADGYAGNITLKTMEGTVLTFSKLIKKNLTSKITRKIAALFLKKAFKDVKEHFDYRNVGAAWVIGVNGIVIKSHGSSDKKAYLGALEQIKIAIESDALNKLKEVLK